MSAAVVVTFEPGPHGVDARSRLGANDGPAFRFAAPAADADAAAFWIAPEGREVVDEVLALMHLPVVDTLVFALPAAASDEERSRLRERHAGCHTVRETECRSHTLDVTVHRVLVTRAAPDEEAAR